MIVVASWFCIMNNNGQSGSIYGKTEFRVAPAESVGPKESRMMHDGPKGIVNLGYTMKAHAITDFSSGARYKCRSEGNRCPTMSQIETSRFVFNILVVRDR